MPSLPLYDPMSLVRRQIREATDPLASLRNARQAEDLLSEEDQTSLLSQLGQGALSGLAWVGGQLDKFTGSRALRGLLGGKPRELMSIVPFSDTLGLTNREQIVSGEDLLGGEKDPERWDSRDVGGFLLEMVLDPSLPFTFGAKSALSPAGKAVKKSGLLDEALEAVNTAKGTKYGPREGLMKTTPRDIADAHDFLSTSNASPLSAIPRWTETISDALPADMKLDDLMDEPLGALSSFWPTGKLLGTGETAQKIAHGLDVIGEKVKYGKYSPIRAMSTYFDKAARQRSDPLGQKLARSTERELERELPFYRQPIIEVQRFFDEKGFYEGKVPRPGENKALVDQLPKAELTKRSLEDSMAFQRYLEDATLTPKQAAEEGLVDLAEGNLAGVGGNRRIRNAPEGSARQDWYEKQAMVRTARESVMPRYKLPEHLKEFEPYLERLRESIDHARDLVRAQGIEVGELSDWFAQYFPRVRNRQGIKDAQRTSGGKFITPLPNAIARDEDLMNIVGGTATLNRMSLDPEISGILKRNKINDLDQEMPRLIKYVTEKYGDADDLFAPLVADNKYRLGDEITIEEAAKYADNRMKRLIRHMADLDPRHADHLDPMFKTDPVSTALRYVDHSVRTASAAKGTHKFFAMVGGHPNEFAGKVGAKPATLAMQQAGITDDNWMTALAEQITSSATARENLRKAHGPLAKGHFPKVYDTSDLKYFFENQFYIPDEHIQEVARYIKSFTAPEEVGYLVKALDVFTNSFKTGVTALFPAFHTRNLVSGTFNNFISGAHDPRPGLSKIQKYAQPLLDTKTFLRGGAIPDIKDLPEFRRLGMDDVKATKALAEEIVAQDLIHGHFPTTEVTGTVSTPRTAIPGMHKQSLGTALGELVPKRDPITGKRAAGWANPLGFRGIGVDETTNVAGRAGEAIGNLAESYNRIAPYIAYRRQGLSPVEAARKVKLAQVDYAHLTPFEKTVLRRVVPFYSFTRRQLPFILEHLADRPSGAMAQVIRGQGRAQRENEFSPPHIAAEASIGGMPGAPEGHERYLTGFGLAHEGVLNLLRPGVDMLDTIQGTMQEVMGRTNPALKVIPEMATGTSFFSGRNLRDLESPAGRMIANITGAETPPKFPVVDQLLANSPASRLMSTINTATDSRKQLPVKALNLLTGMRLHDVDLQKSRELAIRKLLETKLRGEPGVRRFEHFFAPDTTQLSEQDDLLMKLYRQMAREATRRTPQP